MVAYIVSILMNIPVLNLQLSTVSCSIIPEATQENQEWIYDLILHNPYISIRNRCYQELDYFRLYSFVSATLNCLKRLLNGAHTCRKQSA